MPAIIRDRKKLVVWLLLLCFIVLMVSCASEKPPALVGDPSDRPESPLPWNRQEKWEVGTGIPSQLSEGH